MSSNLGPLFAQQPPPPPNPPPPLPYSQRIKLPPDRGITLADAQLELRGFVEDGGSCPCCAGYTKVYTRNLNSGMAWALVLFYKEWWSTGQDWFHALEVMKKNKFFTGDYSLMRFWDLLDGQAKPPGENHVGLYKLSDLGKQFVKARATVKRSVVLFNDTFIDRDGPDVSIVDCLKKESHFDYQKLMEGIP